MTVFQREKIILLILFVHQSESQRYILEACPADEWDFCFNSDSNSKLRIIKGFSSAVMSDSLRFFSVCVCDIFTYTCLTVCCCVCDSSVGRPKHVRVMAGALEGDLFIGPKAEVTQTQSRFLSSSFCSGRLEH